MLIEWWPVVVSEINLETSSFSRRFAHQSKPILHRLSYQWLDLLGIHSTCRIEIGFF